LPIDMVRVLSFPAFPALDAVTLFAVCLLAPVLFWVIIVISLCHIMCWLLLVSSILGFHYLLPILSEVIIIFAL